MTRGELKDEIKSIISECMLEMNNSSDDIDVEHECVAFVDNYFLNFVEESAKEDNAKLEKILSKFKINKDGTFANGELTEKDINDAVNIIKNIAPEDLKLSQNKAEELIMAIYSALGAGLNIYVGIAFNSSFNIIIGSICAVATLLTSASIASGCNIINISTLNSYYDKIMKVEAKTKAKLKKAEGLEDKSESDIKMYKNVIANCEKLRNNYKTIVNKLENIKPRAIDKSGAFKECFTVTESGEVEFVQEMKGNQMKIELFKQIVDDCDEVLRARYSYISEIDKNISETLNIFKSVKNKEDGAKAVVSLKEKLREFNSKSQSNELLKKKAMNDLFANTKSFTVKYSFESMKIKKSIGAKVEKYRDDIINIGKKFDGETGSINNQIASIIDKLELSDSFGENSARMISQFEAIIESWQKGIVSMCNDTIKDCNKILNYLNIGTEKSIVFKLLNRKERKAEKKAEKSK